MTESNSTSKVSNPGDSLHGLIRLVEPHDARIEALNMFPLPSLMERRAWAEDWIRSNSSELARAAFPVMDEDKQDWRTSKHKMGVFVQAQWENECVQKWAREMNATFDRHRNKWVIVNPPNAVITEAQPGGQP